MGIVQRNVRLPLRGQHGGEAVEVTFTSHQRFVFTRPQVHAVLAEWVRLDRFNRGVIRADEVLDPSRLAFEKEDLSPGGLFLRNYARVFHEPAAGFPSVGQPLERAAALTAAYSGRQNPSAFWSIVGGQHFAVQVVGKSPISLEVVSTLRMATIAYVFQLALDQLEGGAFLPEYLPYGPLLLHSERRLCRFYTAPYDWPIFSVNLGKMA